MHADPSEPARILDAAATIIVRDGLDAATAEAIANEAHTTIAGITSIFGSVEDALVTMLNREFTAMYLAIVDQIERDPRGGLLSRIYLYTFSTVYERPLAKTLYTADRDALNRLMRTANSFGYVPGVGIRADFIESMQAAGMVRRDVDAAMVSNMLTIFSAGLALTAPHENLDLIVRSVTDLLAKAVDVPATDTVPGKRAYYAWAAGLSA